MEVKRDITYKAGIGTFSAEIDGETLYVFKDGAIDFSIYVSDFVSARQCIDAVIESYYKDLREKAKEIELDRKIDESGF